MNRPLRRLWGLAVLGGAIAVAVTTHDAGFTAITLLGGLAVPRILGFGGRWQGRGGWGAGCDRTGGRRAHLEGRLGDWHREAHTGSAGEAPGVPTPASAAQA